MLYIALSYVTQRQNPLNLNQLRVFDALARTGSVSAAARGLRVSQPAVSKQLAELESSLALRLFDRLPRGVRLTEAGRVLAGFAERMFALESAAEKELTGLRAGRSVTLRIGASTTIGSYLVPTLFGALKKLAPDAELSLNIGNTAQTLDLVRLQEVDLGLTEGLMASDEFVSRPFSEDELIAITAPGDELAHSPHVTLSRLVARPILVRERGSGTREVLEKALAEHGFNVRPALELGSTEALKNAAANGLGVAFVSLLSVELELKMGRLARITPMDFKLTRTLHSVQLPYQSDSPIVTLFKGLLGATELQAHLV
jgi:DNA-binding transcriptional LysR family regulator